MESALTVSNCHYDSKLNLKPQLRNGRNGWGIDLIEIRQINAVVIGDHTFGKNSLKQRIYSLNTYQILYLEMSKNNTFFGDITLVTSSYADQSFHQPYR